MCGRLLIPASNSWLVVVLTVPPHHHHHHAEQEMKFPKPILKVLKGRGIAAPTPIQIQGLPVAYVQPPSPSPRALLFSTVCVTRFCLWFVAGYRLSTLC